MKKIISILFITCMCLVCMPNLNFAVLQSNGNTPARYPLNTWPSKIREMEKLGGAMGLTETLNDNLTSTTSNNIDVHMEKNTEYGAMAILSASSYGNPNIIANGDTTTGNKTGIVINFNAEWVSAKARDDIGMTKNVPKRYVDAYQYNSSQSNYGYKQKIGDATVETNSWHNSKNNSVFILDDCANTGMRRVSKTSIFDYDGYHYGYMSDLRKTGYASRAVVVCGKDL